MQGGRGCCRGHDCSGNANFYFCSDATAHANDTYVYNETTQRQPKYSVFGVDGPIVAKDIYTNGSWKTIALAGFGKGGRGYTVVDVTNPDFPIHMFTILNDIKGPGLARGIKIWQTTLNASSNLYETSLIEYDYAMAIETTQLSSAVSSTELATMPVVDASSFSSAGYVTVTRGDGTEENIPTSAHRNITDL